MHGRGGWAAPIEQAGTVREISGGAHGTTRNRVELTAICEALETLTGVIEVRTDSAYIEKCFNQQWDERWLRGSRPPLPACRVRSRSAFRGSSGLACARRAAINPAAPRVGTANRAPERGRALR